MMTKKMLEQNEKPLDPKQTILNFCLIFRTDLITFAKIRDYLLNTKAELIYQTKSADKILIEKTAEVEINER
jgi:hypothetical protein